MSNYETRVKEIAAILKRRLEERYSESELQQIIDESRVAEVCRPLRGGWGEQEFNDALARLPSEIGLRAISK